MRGRERLLPQDPSSHAVGKKYVKSKKARKEKDKLYVVTGMKAPSVFLSENCEGGNTLCPFLPEGPN